MTLLTYQGTTRGRTLNDGILVLPTEEATREVTGMTSQRIVNPAQRPASTSKGRQYEALILVS